ncbi:hypothetical protein BC829DRAFT_382522 [Chytridium lagenaria]|nr:hypothetical protein BC829DRAFT_382522 [Chytridium lagenaria]
MYRKKDKAVPTVNASSAAIAIDHDVTPATEAGILSSSPATSQGIGSLFKRPTTVASPKAQRKCSPQLARLTRLSKGWRKMIVMFSEEESKRFREILEEAECWGHRPPSLADDVVGCDPIVLHRILWEVYAPRIMTAAGVVAGSGGSGVLGGGGGFLVGLGGQSGLRYQLGGAFGAVVGINAGGTGGTGMGGMKDGKDMGSSILGTSGLNSAVGGGGNGAGAGAGGGLRVISRAATSNSAMGGQSQQAALLRLTAHQRQLFRSFRIALDTYAEGGWASIAPLKDFIRKMRLQYVIPQNASSAPALSMLAEGVSSAAAAGGGGGQNISLPRRPSGPALVNLSSILESSTTTTTTAGPDAASTTQSAVASLGEPLISFKTNTNDVAESTSSTAPPLGATSTTTSSIPVSTTTTNPIAAQPSITASTASQSSTSSKLPAMPSTTTSTSTPTATLLTAQDIRPRPPRDPSWSLLNADLCRLASAHGHDYLLPTLADLDPDATSQLLTLAVSDATRHRRHACLTSLLDAARLVPGALWPCLDRALGSAIEAEEDGCPTSSACVLLLLDAACNDRAGPRFWVDRVSGAGVGGGGVIWGAIDSRERMSAVVLAAQTAAAAAHTAITSMAAISTPPPAPTPLTTTARKTPSLSSLPSLANLTPTPSPSTIQDPTLQALAQTTLAMTSLTSLTSITTTHLTTTATALLETARSVQAASELAASVLEKVDEVRKLYGIPWHRFPKSAAVASPSWVGLGGAFGASLAAIPGDDSYRVVAAGDVASGLVNGLLGRRSVV